jgi:branched-chain amino acid transport system substrate-binding protein
VRKTLCLLAALASAFALAACGSDSNSGGSAKSAGSGASGDPITLGALVARTEPYAAFGKKQEAAYNLAIKRINAKGGVLGRPLELSEEDLGADASSGIAAVQKLLARKPTALIGVQFSFVALPLVPIVNSAKVPTLFGATVPELNPQEKGSEWYFRTVSDDSIMGQAQMQAATAAGAKTAAIIHGDGDLELSFDKQMKTLAAQNGIKIVTDQQIENAGKDFTAQLRAVGKANPDVVFTHMIVPPAALLAKGRTQLAIKSTFLWGPEISVANGFGLTPWESIADDYVMADPLAEFSADAEVRAFATDYKAETGQTPDFLSTQWYNGILMLADAIERAKSTDAAAIADALRTTKDFTGYKGIATSGITMTCDAKQNCAQGMDIYKISGGKPENTGSFKPQN